MGDNGPVTSPSRTVVLGGGPGGYEAALVASSFGAEVTVVDSDGLPVEGVTVGGGALRDVVLGKTPAMFGGNTLYATSAILASAVLVVLSPLSIGPVGTVAAMSTGMLITLLARKLQWRLPGSYSWSPRQALVVLPRPRWRPRRRFGRREDGEDRRSSGDPA